MTPAGLLGTLSDWYERNQDKLVGSGIRGAATRGLLGLEPPKEATKAEMEAYRNFANASMALAAGPVAAAKAAKGVRRSQLIQDALEKKYPDVKLSLSGDQDVYLGKIVVPKEMRNSGVGTQVMDDLVRQADQLGSRVTLTPSSDFGGSVGRLKDFYKRFGFVENKGRNKDFSISEAMYREPKATDAPTYPQAEALETARQNAVKMLGLPESNTAMDRAKAMGFDTPAVHFSRHGVDVRELDSGKFAIAPFDAVGTHVGSPQAAMERFQNTVGYKVNNPSYALDELKGVTYPVVIRKGKEFLSGDKPWNEDALSAELRKRGGHNWADVNRGGKTYPEMNEALRQKLFQEYGAIPYINDVEAKGQISYIVPPKNIRSRFAAFDPARIDEKDLLASLAAMGITLPLTMGLLSDQTD